MPTDSESKRNTDVIKTLTRVGIILYVAWAFWLFQVMYRVTQVAAGVSAGLWEQRIETVFAHSVSLSAAEGILLLSGSVALMMTG